MARARLVGINHVALEVGDIDQALDFYGRIFEFTLRGRGARMAFIDMGDQFLALSAVAAPSRDGARHFGLVVDDMEAARRALDEAGAEVLPGAASTSSTRGGTTSRSSSTTRSSSPRPSRCCAGWASIFPRPRPRGGAAREGARRAMTRYVVLLRAVNVGGTGKVPMPRLRELLAEAGLEDVATYVQSGNVVVSPGTRHRGARRRSGPPCTTRSGTASG